VVSRDNNSWTVAKPSSTTATRPPKTAHTSLGSTNASQYTVQTTNRFTVLSRHTEPQQLNGTTFSSDFVHPSRLIPKSNNRYDKGRHWKKSSATEQFELSTTHLLDIPNLPKPKKNEDGASPIPTIVNGVTSVNPNPKHMQEDSVPTSDSITHLINNLSDSINVLNKTKCPPSGNHRIILIGDSHIRGYGNTLKPFLNSDYNLYSVVKPGSGTEELMASASEVIRRLSHDDLVVVCSGTNDYDLNNFPLTFRNIKNYIMSNNHTNILLMNVPFRYDLPNSSSINKNISLLNRRLQKLAKAFPHSSFLGTFDNRNLFTTHGLHRSKLGKKLVNLQL
jgi:hypothetical protein